MNVKTRVKHCICIILHSEARTLKHTVILTVCVCVCVRPAGEEIPEVRLCRDGASFCGGAAFVGQPAHGEPGESASVQRRSGLQTEAQTLLHEQLLPGHGRRGRHPVQVRRGAVLHSGGGISSHVTVNSVSSSRKYNDIIHEVWKQCAT